MNLRAGSATPQRTGIGTALVVVVVVIVLAVASIAGYLALSSKSPSAASTSSTTSSTTKSASSLTTTTQSETTSSSGSGATYYSGTFNFSLPEGPSGVRSLSNGSAQYYNSVQTASGKFSFSLAASGLTGSGTGNGTFTMTTTGFCSGSVTFPYTFTITDVTTEIQGNLTIFFGNSIPGNYSVPLSCTGDMTGVSTATNNPGPFLPIYPNELSIPIASLPTSELFHGTPSTTFVWGYTLEETS